MVNLPSTESRPSPLVSWLADNTARIVLRVGESEEIIISGVLQQFEARQQALSQPPCAAAGGDRDPGHRGVPRRRGTAGWGCTSYVLQHQLVEREIRDPLLEPAVLLLEQLEPACCKKKCKA